MNASGGFEPVFKWSRQVLVGPEGGQKLLLLNALIRQTEQSAVTVIPQLLDELSNRDMASSAMRSWSAARV